MQNLNLILCPICNRKTKVNLRQDTVLANFPLFCPKCKRVTLINANKEKITIVEEPDVTTQSR